MDHILDARLHNVHDKRNIQKALQYWLGFLKGVLASKDVISLEIKPLENICIEFIEKCNDQDAPHLLDDIDILKNNPKKLYKIISNIILLRSKEIDGMDNRAAINIFYGFLKGIACDGMITLHEVKTLLKYLDENEDLLDKDSRIKDIQKIARLSIRDGKISRSESDEICGWISKVVGDSYADTGIGLSKDVPSLDGMLGHFDNIEFIGKKFVLTGRFEIPKKAIKEIICDYGGHVQGSVTLKTDYLVLAESGSHHYLTPNAGTKILYATQLHKKNKKPQFIMEHKILSIFQSSPLKDD